MKTRPPVKADPARAQTLHSMCILARSRWRRRRPWNVPELQPLLQETSVPLVKVPASIRRRIRDHRITRLGRPGLAVTCQRTWVRPSLSLLSQFRTIRAWHRSLMGQLRDSKDATWGRWKQGRAIFGDPARIFIIAPTP
jgi:hypothetical protein